jgi:hypothetical protein
MPAAVSGASQGGKPVVLRPRVLVPFAIAVLVVIAAAVYGVVRPHDHVQLKGPGTTGKLHWGGGVFTSKAELRAWLNTHGRSYAAFAAAHPAAVRMLPAETARP